MGVPVVARSYQSKLGWPEGKQNLLAISHPVATIGSAQHPATGSDQLATDLRSEVVIWGIRRQRQALECGNIALRIPVVVRLSHAEATPKAPTLLDCKCKCKCKCNEPAITAQTWRCRAVSMSMSTTSTSTSTSSQDHVMPRGYS
ncbi:uncharacterized protein G6M90_00g074470 [Metarhizium brunneum]|uniref:Uncharacterized protein n=1 Tax=Metarhizium brunneum TaxID=500148 RepID=A0A7D5V2N9_9HYPO|nr:hypothetical protein G6M90_00g074470 [Metarhizium brunneum]